MACCDAWLLCFPCRCGGHCPSVLSLPAPHPLLRTHQLLPHRQPCGPLRGSGHPTGGCIRKSVRSHHAIAIPVALGRGRQSLSSELDFVSFPSVRAGRQGPPTRTAAGVPAAVGSHLTVVTSDGECSHCRCLLGGKNITQKLDSGQQNCSCGKSGITGERTEMRVGDAVRWAFLGSIQIT